MTTSALVGTDWSGPRSLLRMLVRELMPLMVLLRHPSYIRRMERVCRRDPLPRRSPSPLPCAVILSGRTGLQNKESTMSDNTETAILAGGCFWGVQELLRH